MTTPNTNNGFISTIKRYVKQKRILIEANQGPGGPGHRYRNNKARRWKVVNKTNVKGYYNQNFTNVGVANNVNKNKLVFLDVDLRNGKVQHVYHIDGIAKLLASGGYMAKSPLTRKEFELSNVQPF